jgi:hypothetical protein
MAKMLVRRLRGLKKSTLPAVDEDDLGVRLGQSLKRAVVM